MKHFEVSISSAANCKTCDKPLTIEGDHDVDMCAAANRAHTRIQVESMDSNMDRSHYLEARDLVEGDLTNLIGRHGAETVREAAVDLIWAWEEMSHKGALGLECFVEKLKDDGLEGEFKEMILRVLEWSGNGIAEVMGIQDALLSAAMHDIASEMLSTNGLEVKDLREEASLGQDWAGDDDEAVDENDPSRICNTMEHDDEMDGVQTSFAPGEEANDREGAQKASMETDETLSFARDLTGRVQDDRKREEHFQDTRDLPLQRNSTSMYTGRPENTTTDERTETAEETIESEDAITTIYTTTTIRTVTVVVPRDGSRSNKGEKVASDLETVLAPKTVMRRGEKFSDAEKLWLMEHLDDDRPIEQVTEDFNHHFANQKRPAKSGQAVQDKITTLLAREQPGSYAPWTEDQVDYLLDALRPDVPLAQQVGALNLQFAERGWPERSLASLQQRVVRMKINRLSVWPREQEEYLAQIVRSDQSVASQLDTFNQVSAAQGWPVRSLSALCGKVNRLERDNVGETHRRKRGRPRKDSSALSWPAEQAEYLLRFITTDKPLTEQLDSFNDYSIAQGWPTRSIGALYNRLGRTTNIDHNVSSAWSKEQEDFLKRFARADRSVAEQVASFNAQSEERGWPIRSVQSVQKRLLKLQGRRGQQNAAWPEEQLQYLAETMDDGTPVRTLVTAFNAHSEAQGWPTRTVGGLENKITKLRAGAKQASHNISTWP